MFKVRERRNPESSTFVRGTADTPHGPQIHTRSVGTYLWMWDEPQHLLSVSERDRTQSKTAFTLSLNSLCAFRCAVDRYERHQLDALESALMEIRKELENWEEIPPWPAPLYDAIGLLLLYLVALEEADDRLPEGIYAVARAVVERLPAESARGAWRVAFQSKLTPPSRAGVLAAAAGDNAAMGDPELVWWTARCRVHHAFGWYRSEQVQRVPTVEAVREVTEATTRYIRLLQAGPSRRTMEDFFAAMGSNSEDEILCALRFRSALPLPQDRLRAEITLWLLRRYSLSKACTLLRGTFSRREMIGGWTSVFVLEVALFLFIMQTMPRTQVALQLGAFAIFVFSAPRILALLLPRALFGTLLAWLTVVLAQAASLLPIISNDDQVHSACHLWLTRIIRPAADLHQFFVAFQHGRLAVPAIFEFGGMLLAGGLISITFLNVEVQDRLAAKSVMRSTLCFFVMLAGSLFWGAMLVPTLQYIIAREPLGTSCGCIYPAWLLGSVCAVAFGILVQLMWDDHAVADSLGLPIESTVSK